MAHFEKHCLSEGCTAQPGYGYQPSKTAPMKWACREHKHLLEREAAPPPPSPPTKPESDLFGPR